MGLLVRALSLLLLITYITMALCSCSEVPSFENGKSAYQLAVENGFVGTETEWLALLQQSPPADIVDVVLADGNVTLIYGDGTAESLGDLPGESLNYLTLLLLPDDTYAVLSCDASAAGEVIVPEYHLDKPITRILSGAFRGCTALISLTLPRTLTAIGKSALQGCSNLTHLSLPFVGSAPNATVNTHLGFLFGAKNTAAQETAVPASLTHLTVTGGSTLAPFALANCTSLLSVSLPDTLTSVGFGALQNCVSLTELTLPFIGESRESAENWHFSYIFGAERPAEQDGLLPASLTTVRLTDTASLHAYAFYHCTVLRSIYLPASLTTIGSYAFGASLIEHIFFENSEGWQAADGTLLPIGEDSAANAALLTDTYRAAVLHRVAAE